MLNLKKTITAFILIISGAFMLNGCGADLASDKEYYSFTDSVGNTVTLSEKPEKTAVLFSSFADIWIAAGGRTDITVGEAVERGFADNSSVLVDGGAGKSIDVEALIAAEPDFVICSADIAAQREAAELLQNADIACAQLRVESFEDYLAALKIFTEITGNSAAYDKNGLEVKARIEDILEKIPENSPQKKILFIRSGSGASSAKAKTASEHFAAAMLEELGAYNIADNAPILLDGLSIEEIIIQNPDMIFISPMGNEQAAKAYMDEVIKSPAWQALDAVAGGNYFYLPKTLFQYKPNAEWDKAYLYLAGLLYPEVDF